MTTTPDPQLVHPPTVVERKRRLLDSPYGQQLHDLAEEPILACELRELVALAERARPAEQPQDDGDALDDTADPEAEAVRAVLDNHDANSGFAAREYFEYNDGYVRAVLDNRKAWRNVARSRGEERNRLAARVAELEAHPALLLQADAEEREADVRAVAVLLDLLARTDQRNRPKVLHEPTAALRALFADRIAALEARDATAGEQQ